jgi:enoyl-CoA hydratase/carnithine racemase
MGDCGIRYSIDADGICVITLGGEGKQEWGTPLQEHRMTSNFLARIQGILDEIEDNVLAKAVIFIGEGKFFCNGVDLAWIDAAHGVSREAGSNDLTSGNTGQHPVWKDSERFLSRILTFPLPTCAALNGHWVALGCMWGLACDYRVMRSDRGIMFVPGVDIGAVYSPGMTELMRSKVPHRVVRDMMTFARRFSGPELLSEGVLEAACPLDELLAAAKKTVEPWLGKGRKGNGGLSTMGGIKRVLYKEAVELLATPRARL